MPKKDKAKRAHRFFTRAAVGTTQGIIECPISMNKKAYSIIREKFCFNEIVLAHELFSLALLEPAFAVFGVFWGAVRGMQEGIKNRDEHLGAAIRKTHTEFFTFDSVCASSHNELSKTEIMDKAERAGVSVRKLYPNG
ncbi:Uncharacterised protein [Legionella lansingensis]|uniref:Uncharacterized protein n=1 Tax=Legionella lansingensis TaxID=45067 RepID=A0A0W0VUM3_9GAMM|nr:hypothetical protein [Legionella lansingensis]KTD23820.1 hypothetical protein Llan_0601 [Legionella lansingensis]SNV46857.1 Uncharacterised protein [Legionella lansingensis]